MDRQQVSFDGTVDVTATLDLADAYDLDTAVTVGPPSWLRSAATTTSTPAGHRPGRAWATPGHARLRPARQPRPGRRAHGLRPAGRQLVLYVHLSRRGRHQHRSPAAPGPSRAWLSPGHRRHIACGSPARASP
ncbi:MAG: hypothetical protein R2734_01910 [Nocardioides sp.]